LQGKADYSVLSCGALIISILLASQGIALAQTVETPAAPPAEGATTPDCASDRPATPSATDTAVTLSPPRGWQMEGREVEVSIASSNRAADPKPLVCFRWKRKDGTGKFVPAGTVRIVQKSPASQQPPTPPSLRLAAPVPQIAKVGGGPPTKKDVEYTPYDEYAPIAEVRILMLGDNKKLIDVVTTVAIVKGQDYCNVPIGPGVRIDNGTIVPSPSKNWQPVGGEIEFTVKTPKTFPNDALIKVCFRWTVAEGEHFEFSQSGPIRIVDRQPSSLKLAVGVPAIWGQQPGRPRPNDGAAARIGSYAVLGAAVPEADLRVLVFDNDLTPVFDIDGKTGVTSIGLAGVLAFLALAVAFALLCLVCRRRFPNIRNSPLCLITTPRGFASLSQFQIVLWTFVVMTSAVYVIALAGDLIVITPGTLILLGISGAAALLAKVKTPPQPAAATVGPVAPQPAAATAAPVAPQPAAAAAAPVAPQPAAAAAAPVATAGAGTQAANGPIRQPRWSDLVMEETKGLELDVTRVQMLLFTLVTAVFVVMKVITSYEIPDIPDGFLILMGISNGVYVGSKFTPA
jgi:hypothetical protein